MYITDVVLDKNVLKQVNQKVNFSIFYLVLFIINIVVSTAFIIFSIIKSVSNFDAYLFGGFGVLIPVFWIFVVCKELKTYKEAKKQILENGSYTLSTPTEVNPERKHNVSTILNVICAILVFGCLVATVVSQILSFDVTTLYTVVMLFVLTVFMCYQTTVSIINDKMFRAVIFNKD